jgi:hypothetical protein
MGRIMKVFARPADLTSVVCVLGVAALVAAPLAVCHFAGSARMALDSGYFDASRIAQGTIVAHTFPFRNGGKRELRIVGVSPGCSCASAVWTRSVPPGGSGEIVAQLFTSNLEGRVTRTFAVESNDRWNSPVLLSIAADVVPQFTVVPRLVDFGTQPAGNTPGRTVFITREFGDSELLGARSSDSSVTVTLTVLGGDRSRAQIDVMQRADAPPGTHFGNVVVRTSSGTKPELRIPIRGSVHPGNPTSSGHVHAPPDEVTAPEPVKPPTNTTTDELAVTLDAALWGRRWSERK